MNTVTILISAITAFIIAAGGAIGVAIVGGPLTKWQVVAAVVLGLGVAAKDTRSLLKLPPVDSNPNNPDRIV